MPLRIEPERSELPENRFQSARTKGADVFEEEIRRRATFVDEFADESDDFKEKPGSLSGESGAFSGKADVLTREAAADDIDSLSNMSRV